MGARGLYPPDGSTLLPLFSPLSPWNRRIADAGLHLAHLSGATRISERRNAGAGTILRFEHVRPRRRGGFQPLRAGEIRPEFLERAIRALRRWDFDFISIDDAASRAKQSGWSRRFVCLTFDGGSRDFMEFAYPILSRHGVPFALYVATGFVDGIGEAWWLALEEVVARNTRVSLVMNGTEQRFNAMSRDEKHQLYALLYGWMRSLQPRELSAAITDLCKRHDVNLKAVSQNIAMTWTELAKIARNPQATIGSATVHYPALAPAKGTVALREMAMGKSVIETALDAECRHFAYPFGDGDTFGPRDILLAQDAGFATAVSTHPGFIRADNNTNVLSLPRSAWDGRGNSINLLRAVLSGFTLRQKRKETPEPEVNYG